MHEYDEFLSDMDPFDEDAPDPLEDTEARDEEEEFLGWLAGDYAASGEFAFGLLDLNDLDIISDADIPF
jgi:hypothetical protein